MPKRIKLAEDLKKAADIFHKDSVLGTDLRTMSFAIENMSSEKFASVVDEGRFQKYLEPAAKEASAEESHTAAAEPVATNLTQEEKDANMSESNKQASDGSFWTKDASDHVRESLVRDVIGSVKNDASSDREDGLAAAKLPAEQIPDGKPNPGQQNEGADPEPAAKLTPEQTPKDDKNHDSDIVAESNKVKTTETKQASDGTKEATKEATEEPKEDMKAEDAKESCKDAADVEPKEAKKVQASVVSEGIELQASFDDVEGATLTDKDQALLGRIFD